MKNKEQRIAQYLNCPTICKNCSSILCYEKRLNLFCSKSCSASYNNKCRPPNPNRYKKVSTTLKGTVPYPLQQYRQKNNICGDYCKVYFIFCKFCHRQFSSGRESKVYCSKECQNESQKIWLRNNRSHIKGSGKKSYMEVSFSQWLKENYCGRWYSEVHFKNKENNKHGWVDFLFPKEKIIIELDGTHHLKRAEIDHVRDEYLLRVRGYTVIRITHQEYKSGKRIDFVKSILGIGLA